MRGRLLQKEQEAGFNNENGIGFGLKHIKKREKDLQKLGFNSAEDYVGSF